MVYSPAFVAQARHDHMINTDSANIIYNEVESDNKHLKWYEESGHVITLDKERDQLHADVHEFLESLDWQ
jgi:carboxylesterase